MSVSWRTLIYSAWAGALLLLWLFSGCLTRERHAMWLDPNGHERLFMYPYQQPDYK